MRVRLISLLPMWAESSYSVPVPPPLCGTDKKGKPSQLYKGGASDLAEELYEYIISRCKEHAEVSTGSFGADMKVSLVNDGPFTILLDDKEL